MHSLFLSDLHLDGSRPNKIALFQRLAQAISDEVTSVYILGDLFEFWNGDDDLSSSHSTVLQSIKSISERGTPVYVMRGNRDFLLGHDFAKQTGAVLLDDPSVIELFGQRVLIMHGDLLCTDDHAYQRLRCFTNHGLLQRAFLLLPLKVRRRISRRGRRLSHSQNQIKAPSIMDVNQQTVEAYMNEHAVQTLIHGHTHRQALHSFHLGQTSARRLVLGDWYQQDSLLVYAQEEQIFLTVEDYLLRHR